MFKLNANTLNKRSIKTVFFYLNCLKTFPVYCKLKETKKTKNFAEETKLFTFYTVKLSAILMVAISNLNVAVSWVIVQ